jgi:hypothetical protein
MFCDDQGPNHSYAVTVGEEAGAGGYDELPRLQSPKDFHEAVAVYAGGQTPQRYAIVAVHDERRRGIAAKCHRSLWRNQRRCGFDKDFDTREHAGT